MEVEVAKIYIYLCYTHNESILMYLFFHIFSLKILMFKSHPLLWLFFLKKSYVITY